jgi:tripartite-type tricarboxylate transporter receptor subunit TctC
VSLGTRSITLLWLFLATCTRTHGASLTDETNSAASTRDYPTRPVRIIEPLGAGLGPDLLARALAPKLSELWNQPVTVENHSGMGATAGPALVAKSPADGYTLLINTERHAYSAALLKNLPYDPLKDFTPTASLASQPYVLLAGKPAGVSTVGELIAAAKAKPGELRFGSTGVGTGTHLCAVKFNFEAGIRAADVPPRAGDVIADVLADTIEGRTTYMFAPVFAALSQIRDGKLLPLGVSTTRRSTLLPEVPTIAEAGVTGFNSPLWYGIWVPAGTPTGVVDKLAQDIARALAEPDMREWLAKHGAAAMNMTQPEFARFVQSESESAARLIKSAPRTQAPDVKRVSPQP